MPASSTQHHVTLYMYWKRFPFYFMNQRAIHQTRFRSIFTGNDFEFLTHQRNLHLSVSIQFEKRLLNYYGTLSRKNPLTKHLRLTNLQRCKRKILFEVKTLYNFVKWMRMETHSKTCLSLLLLNLKLRNSEIFIQTSSCFRLHLAWGCM